MELERVKERVLEGRPGFPRAYGPARVDHQPGIPLCPQEATRALVVIFLLTAIMFFLSSYLTPFLGPARSPQISELIVPDWYLLFSWGLLKIADIFPTFTLGAGTPLGAEFNPVFWGDVLSGIPIIALLLLPFLDRGREARPAKAPIRSAIGTASIAAIFTASLYSIREVISERWLSPNGAPLIPDNTQKWFFVIPPILVGLVTYTALRRLGYQPMRRWLVPNVTVPAIIVCAQSAAILLLPGWLGAGGLPYVAWVAVHLVLLSAASAAVAVAVIALPETR